MRLTESGIVETPDDAPQFMELLGTQFAGLRDLSVVDELYLTRKTAEFTTLLHTSFVGNCPEFGAEEWDEAEVPVMYERAVGKGAIMYLILGHCRGHYDLQPLAPYYPHPERCAWNYPVFYELLRRGIAWGTRVGAKAD